MSVVNPGSIRGKSGKISVWRIPNFLMEPRGSFLGESNEFVDRLNKIRSVIGAIIVIGMIVHYSGLAHLGYTGGQPGGLFDVTDDTPEGHWLLGLIVSATLALLMIPLTSLILVLRAQPGARRATLYQLRWPFISIVTLFGVFAAAAPIASGLSFAIKHMNGWASLVATLFTSAVGFIILVWLIKALYLAATGLFRADDGHPLLGPIAAIGVVWSSAIIMDRPAAGTGGLAEVPTRVDLVTNYGGAVTITALSLMTISHLKRKYKSDWPFRNGPIR